MALIPSAISGVRLATPNTYPTASKFARSDEPPYEMNGSVTPITGISEVAEPIFTATCAINQHAIAAQTYREKSSLVFNATLILTKIQVIQAPHQLLRR